jgi:hypothetical protein
MINFQKNTLKNLSTMMVVVLLLSQILFCFYALMLPKPAQAIFGVGDITFNTKIGDIYQIIKDIGIAIMINLALKIANKFLTRFVNKLQEKYKIRNYLYYDQILKNYYLQRFIADKIDDPDLKAAFNVLYAVSITGEHGYSNADQRKALIPRLKNAIYKQYLKSGGIPASAVTYKSPNTSSSQYFNSLMNFYAYTPSYVEDNLQGQFGEFQTAATTAAQLEIIVGNGMKAGRLIGGTCKLTEGPSTIAFSEALSESSFSMFDNFLVKTGLVKITYAEIDEAPTPAPAPLPSTPLPIDLTETKFPGQGVDPNTSPQACTAAGGTWQPSALDAGRSFIDNPTGTIVSFLSGSVAAQIKSATDPSNWKAVIGSLVANFIFGQMSLDKSGGTLNEDPRGYSPVPSDEGSQTGTPVDIDGDGLSDGYDIDADGQPDICNYGGEEGAPNPAGPPCKGSKSATTVEVEAPLSGGVTICGANKVSIDVVYHVATNSAAADGGPYDRLSVHLDPNQIGTGEDGGQRVDDDILHVPPDGALLDFTDIDIHVSGGVGGYLSSGPYEREYSADQGKARHTLIPPQDTWIGGGDSGATRVDLRGVKGEEIGVGAYSKNSPYADGRAEACTPLSNVSEAFRADVTGLVDRLPK